MSVSLRVTLVPNNKSNSDSIKTIKSLFTFIYLFIYLLFYLLISILIKLKFLGIQFKPLCRCFVPSRLDPK